jgi:hypothetical protein
MKFIRIIHVFVPDNRNIKGALYNMFKHKIEDFFKIALMVFKTSLIYRLNNAQNPTCTGKYPMVSRSLSSFMIHATDMIKFISIFYIISIKVLYTETTIQNTTQNTTACASLQVTSAWQDK